MRPEQSQAITAVAQQAETIVTLMAALEMLHTNARNHGTTHEEFAKFVERTCENTLRRVQKRI